jgi:hypothetical protein
MKFTFKQLLATPGASEAFNRNEQSPQEFLERHLSGDWGETCDEDKQLNEQALVDGARLMSVYSLKDETQVWCITEATGDDGQREATTFLLPDEY